jgi:hypothetical protein
MAAALQVLGAIGILVPFAANQFGRMTTDSYIYLWLNMIGSGLLAVLAAADQQWGFLLLEGVWTAVSAWGIVSRARGRRPGQHSPTTA